MKKKFGIITIILTFVITLSCTAVKAYANPISVMWCVTGVTYGGYDVSVGYYTKDSGVAQSVTIDKTSTSLTNPCPNCQIGLKLSMDNGTEWTGAAAKMGETQQMNRNSEWRGNYKLSFTRADFTFLKTAVDFQWNINK